MTEERHPQIVIVKRHARHEEEHHGGAWKIAFADFMTAMMALFLVLWLISSTSEKERRAVAQYFNPVKLVDMTTLKKGFHEPKETEAGGGVQTEPTASESETPEFRQRDVEPAADRAKEASRPARAGAKPLSGHDGKHADAPARKRQEVRDPAARSAARDPEAVPIALEAAFADPFATFPGEPLTASEPEPTESETEISAKISEGPTPASNAAGPDWRQRAAPLGQRTAPDTPEGTPAPADAVPGDAELAALAAEILEGKTADPDKQSAPKLEVQTTNEGVLISLTDAANDSMFPIGSAEPRRKTIEVLQKIARSLATRSGGIVVRGHTDSRPYRAGTSDNWRLSTTRAHAARDVLLRGGLAESRIERVEGYADRSPKVAADPTAPENRRIEILLRKATQ